MAKAKLEQKQEGEVNAGREEGREGGKEGGEEGREGSFCAQRSRGGRKRSIGIGREITG